MINEEEECIMMTNNEAIPVKDRIKDDHYELV
jgi:hypothetical protein